MNLKTLLTAFLLISTLGVQAMSWQYYNGNKYALTDRLSWQGAQAVAQSHGGNLVTINDAAEQSWLVSAFGGQELFWIGFTDQASEGNFQWISGEPVTYTNWNGGEPNNSVDEHWTVMNWDRPSGWNDWEDGTYHDSFPVRGIIEVNGVPEVASTLALFGLGIAGLSLARRKIG